MRSNIDVILGVEAPTIERGIESESDDIVYTLTIPRNWLVRHKFPRLELSRWLLSLIWSNRDRAKLG